MRLFLPSLALVLLGASLGGGPGCIAAVTASPSTSLMSGQTVTFTDGSSISPATHFVSRAWSFGDGAISKSTRADATTVTHVYVNTAGQEENLTMRLTVRTGLSTCTTSVPLQVSTESL